MRSSRRPSPPVPGGFGFPLGLATGSVVTLFAVGAGVTGCPDWSVAALSVTVAGVAALTTPAAALGTASVCWCLHDGFVLGRYGDLVATPAAAGSAAILAAIALATLVVAALVRLHRAGPVRAPD
ncbi:hypothetical protein LWP59_22875 [Amycolatopsis acidiphila]|uniref:Uncharacterized protein n=1 Tax=Amycolatopsis acidiphila TaxID=715473 RepID=A0A558A892_9PSEU|nr:hypothetical protein [Amycolatopsis acidiphila]TVT20477.1 hypothetical protein FNH06_20255 [Amycolatopsis acidiphila]UIJ57001.1 hypothetical protein LWP59_22875 [Amycolatopsis acidiphila]GHG53891.1 hypothetical protein GCM10017788_03030 [Amycolatopsis acidiphila]